jgi:hypothetical protein
MKLSPQVDLCSLYFALWIEHGTLAIPSFASALTNVWDWLLSLLDTPSLVGITTPSLHPYAVVTTSHNLCLKTNIANPQSHFLGLFLNFSTNLVIVGLAQDSNSLKESNSGTINIFG